MKRNSENPYLVSSAKEGARATRVVEVFMLRDQGEGDVCGIAVVKGIKGYARLINATIRFQYINVRRHEIVQSACVCRTDENVVLIGAIHDCNS